VCDREHRGGSTQETCCVDLYCAGANGWRYRKVDGRFRPIPLVEAVRRG
jgi:hypothetical protein